MSHTLWNKKIRIALTGWGSWGHILPLISLMQKIDDTDRYWTSIDTVYRFGQKQGMEVDFYNQYHKSFTHFHPQFISILAWKYRRETIRRSRLKNIRDLFLFPLGVIQSIRHILSKHIDVVFCKGGFVSLPVVIAARICRRPLYVHESDTSAGLTTRIASRFATKNFSWFPDTLPQSLTVGQILSDQLLVEPSSIPFDLPQEKKIILVAGGSLGSKRLYNALLNIVADNSNLQKYHYVLINAQHLIDKDLFAKTKNFITLSWLIKDQSTMGRLYRKADTALVRAGTTTLAECKLFDLPLIIVPLPITHDQANNAQYYVDHYGDTVLDQNNPDFLSHLAKSLASIISTPIHTVPSKTKTKISDAKTIIIDHLLGVHTPRH